MSLDGFAAVHLSSTRSSRSIREKLTWNIIRLHLFVLNLTISLRSFSENMSVLLRRVPWSFPEELRLVQIISPVERRFALNRSLIVLHWMSSRYTHRQTNRFPRPRFSHLAGVLNKPLTFVFNLRWNPLGLFQIFRRNYRLEIDGHWPLEKHVEEFSPSLFLSICVCLCVLFFTKRTKKENKSTNAMRKRKTIIVSFYVLSVPIVQEQEKKLRTKYKKNTRKKESMRQKKKKKRERSACNTHRQETSTRAHGRASIRIDRRERMGEIVSLQQNNSRQVASRIIIIVSSLTK